MQKYIFILCLNVVVFYCNASQDALFKAISVQDTSSVVDILDRHPFLVNARDSAGQTPLFIAIFQASFFSLQKKYFPIISLLVEKYHANVNIPNRNGETPLIVLSSYGGDSELTTLLLRHGADSSATNASGSTPLLLAALHGDVANVRVLAHDRKILDRANIFGFNALHCAIQVDDYEKAGILISQGANIHLKDGNNNTMLMLAASCNALQSVRLLIESGVDMYCKNNDDQDAISIALESKNVAVAQYIHNQMKLKK